MCNGKKYRVARLGIRAISRSQWPSFQLEGHLREGSLSPLGQGPSLNCEDLNTPPVFVRRLSLAWLLILHILAGGSGSAPLQVLPSSYASSRGPNPVWGRRPISRPLPHHSPHRHLKPSEGPPSEIVSVTGLRYADLLISPLAIFVRNAEDLGWNITSC